MFAALDVQPKMSKIHNPKQFPFFEYFSTKYFLTKYTQTVRDFMGLLLGILIKLGQVPITMCFLCRVAKPFFWITSWWLRNFVHKVSKIILSKNVRFVQFVRDFPCASSIWRSWNKENLAFCQKSPSPESTRFWHNILFPKRSKTGYFWSCPSGKNKTLQEPIESMH